MKTAKARFGHGTGRIIVDDCPYCHKMHYHNPPVGSGQRMADCFQGEYILDFSESTNQDTAFNARAAEYADAHKDDPLIRTIRHDLPYQRPSEKD